MKLITSSILAVALAIPLSASAETALHFLGISHHFNNNDTYNNNNYGLLLEHNSWVVGGFKNSYNDDTYIVGLTGKTQLVGPLQVGLLGGLNYGYYGCGTPPDPSNQTSLLPQTRKFCPVFAPYLAWTTPVGIDPIVSLSSIGSVTLSIRITTDIFE